MGYQNVEIERGAKPKQSVSIHPNQAAFDSRNDLLSQSASLRELSLRPAFLMAPEKDGVAKVNWPPCALYVRHRDDLRSLLPKVTL